MGGVGVGEIVIWWCEGVVICNMMLLIFWRLLDIFIVLFVGGDENNFLVFFLILEVCFILEVFDFS